MFPSGRGIRASRWRSLPDEGGQFLLVQLLGVARTMDFLMRKRIVMAQEALELGLVHEVVPPDALDAAPAISSGSFASAQARSIQDSRAGLR